MSDHPQFIQALEMIGEQIDAGVFVASSGCGSVLVLIDLKLAPLHHGIGERGDLDGTAVVVTADIEGNEQNRKQGYRQNANQDDGAYGTDQLGFPFQHVSISPFVLRG